MTSDPSSPTPNPQGPPTSARHFILGTAGHIDHGKTSLVRALSGTNTDRLPEERRRGMTIELGFADLIIGDTRFGIVDVPGHERFVRTMVAGATGIDLALLVIAADDSVMPQTVEHLEILHLLGISRGVVAITKIDMVDPDLVELVQEEIAELLIGTTLEGAPLCPVSSTTGKGLDELQATILRTCRRIEARQVAAPFRIAVDRVFTIQGRGTVVTGSVLRGGVCEGETLEVQPSGLTCRVRGLHSHGTESRIISSGQRAAINVSGIDKDQLSRGCQLTTPGYLQPARMIDVRLDCLKSCGKPIKSTTRARLEFGTCEVPVRIVLLDGDTLMPGESSYAQLRAGQPIVTAFAQRFILRNENATRTIGGGVVLRPHAKRRRHDVQSERDSLEAMEKGAPADRLAEVLREARFLRPTDLQLCARAGIELAELPKVIAELTRDGRWVAIADTNTSVTPTAIDDLARRLSAWLQRHHRQHPDLPGRAVDAVLGYLERMSSRGLARPLFDGFVARKTIKPIGRFVCHPEFAPSLSSADEKLLALMIHQIHQAQFQPPSLDDLDLGSKVDRKRRQRLVTLAVAFGSLVRIDGKMYLHVEAERALREKVSAAIDEHGGVTVAQVREALDSSRKFVVPFMEHLDREGFTRRIGDQRVLQKPQTD